jgi:hypothetical protein
VPSVHAPHMNKRHAAIGLLVLGALAAASWHAVSAPPAAPPAVVPATAPSTEFSAERARIHLRELTWIPRPVGSAGHARARAYLLNALGELGLEPQLQRATGLRRSGNVLRVARVENIVARLAGTDSSAAVVLVSHYDSIPNSFGAADAGHGVAAILETVRALRAGPPLRNDLIVLITDAEETGLLGAKAYVDEHPWARHSGIVLNAEARGHTGPVQMFRTTAGNGRMIRTLARAAPYPAAASLANEIFRRMPNDTDLSVFDEAGHAGMDFANVHDLTHYHSLLDNFDNADPRTLQHLGSYLHSLAQAFGDTDLSELAAADRTYFSVPAIGLVHYPSSWSLALAAMAAILVALAVAWTRTKAELRMGGVGLGMLHLAGALVLLPLLATGAWHVLALLVPEVAWFEHGSPYDSGRYLLGIGLLAIALYAASVSWLRRWLRPAELLVAALVGWALAGLASALWLPGAGYLLLWPLLFAISGLVLAGPRTARHPAAQGLVLLLAALPVVYLVMPVVEGIEVALTLRSVAAPIALVVLALGLLVLQLDFLDRTLHGMLPIPLALAGAAVLAAALLNTGFDIERKKPNSVHYIANLDAGEAWWYSADPAPDEWTRQYLGDDAELGTLPAWAPARLAGRGGVVWRQPAPMVHADALQAELLADETIDPGRRMRLRITAPEGAYCTVVRFDDGVEMSGLRIDDREAPAGPVRGAQAPQIHYFGMPEHGAELEFTTFVTQPLRLHLSTSIPGLPPPEAGAAPIRPDHMMPAGRWGDLTRLQRIEQL